MIERNVTPVWYIEHMFESNIPVDSLEQRLLTDEAEISRRRFHQAQTLRLLEAAQVPSMDGSRSMTEWVASRLDVGPDTARHLLRLSRGMERTETASELASGMISFERAAAEARLSELGASPETVTNSRGLDLSGLWRLVARHRRISRAEEQKTFSDRYLALQPNLDQSSWRLWGQLPGTDGVVVEQALHARGDSLPSPPEARGSVSERNADALTSICLDSLSGSGAPPEESEPASAQITVFLEASLAASSHVEAGVELAVGPRLGPEALSEWLCNGRVDYTVLQDGTPLGVGRNSRVIPPRLRRYVVFRDGGCVIEGCGSRYRLQAHHVLPFSEGGKTEAANLVTICWYHHHVLIHGYGYRIDPESPPGRRRFLRPARAP